MAVKVTTKAGEEVTIENAERIQQTYGFLICIDDNADQICGFNKDEVSFWEIVDRSPATPQINRKNIVRTKRR